MMESVQLFFHDVTRKSLGYRPAFPQNGLSGKTPQRPSLPPRAAGSAAVSSRHEECQRKHRPAGAEPSGRNAAQSSRAGASPRQAHEKLKVKEQNKADRLNGLSTTAEYGGE